MKAYLISIFIFCFVQSFSQNVADTFGYKAPTITDSSDHSISDTATMVTTINTKARTRIIAGVHIGGYAGTMFLLGQAWYKNYPKTSFHTFDDSKEWLQLDKVGHVWTSYNIAKYSKGLWSWAGVPQKKAVWLGGISSVGYQTILEYLDAHSAEWGWSWTDMGSNVFGSAVYVAQELGWKEQRLQFKFSSFPVKYDSNLEVRADELYGKSIQERILKDYNGQTYWLSMNLKSFVHNSELPAWLNVAVGYGTQGVFGGFENLGYDRAGNVIFNRPDIKRQRQWYVSPDIDFTKIKTGKRLVKTLFSLMNMLKMPAPAVELSGGKLKGHLLFF